MSSKKSSKPKGARDDVDRLKRIIENISDVLVEIDPEMIFSYVSPQITKVFGFGPEEVVGKSILDFIHPEDLENAMESISIAADGDDVIKFEFRTLHKDGHYVHVSGSGRMIEEGDDLKFFGAISDISERKTAEGELKESEEKFRLISENTSDLIAITDLEGTYTYLSPSNERFGHKIDDLLGKSGFDLIHPDDIEKLMILLDNAINSTSDETRDIIEYRYRDKAGDWHVLESTATLIKDKPGRSGSIVFISRDITDRNTLVNDLKEKSEFLDSVVNNISEGVFVLDEDFKYVFINPASGRIMEHDPNEWIGERAGSNLHPDDGEKSLKAVLQALEEGHSRCEIRVKASNGKYHDLDMKYNRMMWKDEIHLLGVVNDITERKIAEEKLQKSQEKFKMLFDSASDAMFIADAKTRQLVDCNDEALIMTGFSKGEILSMKADHLHPERALKETMDGFKKQAEGKIKIVESELLTKSEKIIPVAISTAPIIINDKPNVVGIFRDISGRKKSEEALRDSEEKYRNIFDLSPEAIMLVSLDGTILECNDATVKLLGLPKKKLSGVSFMEVGLLFEEDVSKYMNMFSQALKEERTNPFELKLNRGEGRVSWIECFPTALKKDGKTNAIQIIARDITERKRTELEMKRQFLSFDIEEGNIYLVQESHLSQSLKAFKELLEVGYPGLVISRTPAKNFRLDTDRPFSHIWLSEKEGKRSIPPRLKEIEDMIYAQSRGQAILIDGLSYLTSKRGFDKCLSCVQSVMETVHLKDHIILLPVDPLTLSEKELRLLQKETVGIAPQMSMGKMPEKLLEVLRIVHEANIHGTKPSYSDIGLEAGLSKPTTRDRIRKLMSKGCVNEIVKGRNKYLEITEKGRNYMVLK